MQQGGTIAFNQFNTQGAGRIIYDFGHEIIYGSFELEITGVALPLVPGAEKVNVVGLYQRPDSGGSFYANGQYSFFTWRFGVAGAAYTWLFKGVGIDDSGQIAWDEGCYIGNTFDQYCMSTQQFQTNETHKMRLEWNKKKMVMIVDQQTPRTSEFDSYFYKLRSLLSGSFQMLKAS